MDRPSIWSVTYLLLLLIRRGRLLLDGGLVIFVAQVDEIDVRDRHFVDRALAAAGPVPWIRIVFVRRRVVVEARLVQHGARWEYRRILVGVRHLPVAVEVRHRGNQLDAPVRINRFELHRLSTPVHVRLEEQQFGGFWQLEVAVVPDVARAGREIDVTRRRQQLVLQHVFRLVSARIEDHADADAILHFLANRVIVRVEMNPRTRLDQPRRPIGVSVTVSPMVYSASRVPLFGLKPSGAHACAMIHGWHDPNPRWIDKGLAACERALQLDPHLAEVLVARGLLYYVQKKYGEAIEYARMAIERKPDCPGAYNVLARSYFASGRLPEITALVERALDANGDDYNLYIPLGNALENLGHTEALHDIRLRFGRALEQQLEMVPEDVRARILLASVHAECGNSDLAILELQRAIALRPDDSNILYNAACVYARLLRKPEALAMLKKARDHGYHNLAWMARDPDLACLHDDPEFKIFMESTQPAS